jgi:hypothetical protein
VEVEVDTVRVDEPDPPLIALGLKVLVTPEGRPVTASDTLPENPFRAFKFNE